MNILSFQSLPWATRLAIITAFAALLTARFCLTHFKYYSDAELIDIVIKWNLSRHEPNNERDKVYASLAEFHRLNPNCCTVYRWQHYMLPGFGIAGDAVVNVYYKVSDTAEKDKYYDSHVRVSSCGEIRARGGTMEQFGPPS
jgi:hypothetical protein